MFVPVRFPPLSPRNLAEPSIHDISWSARDFIKRVPDIKHYLLFPLSFFVPLSALCSLHGEFFSFLPPPSSLTLSLSLFSSLYFFPSYSFSFRIYCVIFFLHSSASYLSFTRFARADTRLRCILYITLAHSLPAFFFFSFLSVQKIVLLLYFFTSRFSRLKTVD